MDERRNRYVRLPNELFGMGLDRNEIAVYAYLSVNSQNVLREEAVLYGFISGYRLAEGIRGELDEHPSFSIVAEDEKRARKIFEMERGECHGEAPGER